MQIFQNTSNSGDRLKVITLSGTTGVTKNMTLYEYGDTLIAVDCGIGFPDDTMPGVDVVIPDMAYVYENSHKFKGLFITHGHEDHIGAVPYLLQELPDTTIYAGKLVQGFLTEKFKEKKFKKFAQNVSFKLLSPDVEPVRVGPFTIEPFRVNHSIPSAMGFCIRTPEGIFLHMADYKIDMTPVIDKPIDLDKIAAYAKEGVTCLLSDCLGSTTEGDSITEKSIDDTFDELFSKASNRQILVTTISSNISRMHQIITSAKEVGRKVVFSGRSIESNARVARGLGYLPFSDNDFVREQEAKVYEQGQLVYIIAGCYGQVGSSLERLSRDENKDVTLEDNALVVFSADPNPPGVLQDVERMMDNLTLRNAEVIYSKIQENLHVSGHGPRGDLMKIVDLAKPKYFIPIGGTITKVRAYRNMVMEMGYKKESVFENLEGDVVEFFDGKAVKGDPVPTQPVYIDGASTESLGEVVIRDRETLANDGVFVVVVPFKEGTKPLGRSEIITRGFIYVKESKQLMGEIKDQINKMIDKDSSGNWGRLKANIEKNVEKVLFKKTGRSPLLIVEKINV